MQTRRKLAVFLILCIVFVGTAGAAKYMYEIIRAQAGLDGDKLVEKESGSRNVSTENTDIEAEFEYMPVGYQNGTYDQKWIKKLCVRSYYIETVVVAMYPSAEHLQNNTEVKTWRDCGERETQFGDCTGALEANFNSNVIGVAYIGWLSRDTNVNDKGRHPEYSRSVEDLTGVFSIEKFIQLWGNDTCGDVSVDWLPCI